jgi:endoglycosylceramidase
MPAMRTFLPTLLLLAACEPTAPYAPRFAPFDSDGTQLRDAEGRVRIFRGVNLHIAGIFDVTFDDGRAPREPLPGFDASDVEELQALGFDLVRLPINWSAIEPERGQYSTAYLDKVAAIVDLCRAGNVRVLIDLHEDGFSKEICEDGAPLWAITPALAAPLPGGPFMGPDCHTHPAALAAFRSFFANVDGLQDHYAEMLQVVAKRFVGDQNVLGFEIMNEPIATDDEVVPFHLKAAAALRAVDDQHLILFEPVATRNFTNGAPLASAPFPVPGAVYAPHVYAAVFGTSTMLADNTYQPLLHSSISGTRDEAVSWGTPLMITEYGLGSQTVNGPAWITSALDEMDEVSASSAWWIWRDPTPGGWGLFDPNPDGSYSQRPAMLDRLSRPYAQAIGGDLTSVKWDGAQLVVRFRGRADVPNRHDIYWNQGPPAIACDGKSVAPGATDDTARRYTVTCGGAGDHTLTFSAAAAH